MELPKIGNAAPKVLTSEPKVLTKAEIRSKLKAIDTIKAAGGLVPKMLREHLEQQLWGLEGVSQVWVCVGKKCPERIVMMVRAKEVQCPKHGTMKIAWSSK